MVGNRTDEAPTQVYAHVVGSQVTESTVAEQGPLAARDLPLSVEEFYGILLEQGHEVSRYDLATATPAVTRVDGVLVRLFVDTVGFPPLIEVDDSVEQTGFPGSGTSRHAEAAPTRSSARD